MSDDEGEEKAGARGKNDGMVEEDDDLDLDALAQGALVSLPASLSLPRTLNPSLLPPTGRLTAQNTCKGQVVNKQKVSPSLPPSSLSLGGGVKRKADEDAPGGDPRGVGGAKRQALTKSPTPPLPLSSTGAADSTCKVGSGGGGGGGGVGMMVSQADVVQALKQSPGCRMLVSQVRTLFVSRVDKASREVVVSELKALLKKVALVEKTSGGESFVCLKQEFM